MTDDHDPSQPRPEPSDGDVAPEGATPAGDDAVSPSGDAAAHDDVSSDEALAGPDDAISPEAGAGGENDAISSDDAAAAPDAAGEAVAADAGIDTGDPDGAGDTTEFSAASQPADLGQPTPAERALAASAEPSSGGSGRRVLVVAAIVVALLAVGAIAFALVQSRMGSADDALVAIPADAALVMSVDVRHFSGNDGFDRLLEAAQPLAEEVEPTIEDVDDAIAQLDAMLEAELGVTLTDDVFPWVGRSLALSLDDFSETEEPEGVLFVASVRDEDAARDFVTKISTENEAELDRRSIDGASTEAYVLDGDDEAGWMLIEDGLFRIASDESTLRRSIDAATSGESIADADNYRTLVDELPSDRGMWLYVDGETLTGVMNAVSEDMADEMVDEDAVPIEVPDFAMALGVTDIGVAMDFVAVAVDGFEDATLLPPPLGSSLPDDTLLYIGFGVETDPPTIGELIREQSEESYRDLEEFEQDFLGIESLTDLVDHLLPQFAFAMTPSQGSMPMAGALPIDIAAIMSFGIDDRDAVVGIAEDIGEWLGFAGITVEQNGDQWEVLIGPDTPLVVWTITDDALRIGTDRSVLGRFAEGGDDDDADSGDGPTALAELDDALPGDGINFYVDIAGMVEVFGAAGPDTEAFSGFEAVAASMEHRGDLAHIGMIIKLSEQTGEGVDALAD